MSAPAADTVARWRDGLSLGPLGLGTAPLGDLYARLPEQQARATLHAALDAGVRWLDTAPLYGHGLAEHRIGCTLRERGGAEPPLLSTKVGRVMVPGLDAACWSGYAGGLPHAARFDYSHDGAWRSLEQSLLRLGRARVEMVLIHDVDPFTHGTQGYEQRYRECMAGSYRALHAMREQGLVAAIGVGVNDAAVCQRFVRDGDFDLMMLAGRYTLLEQGAAPFLDEARARGIGVLLAGVLNSGILAQGAVAGTHYDYRAPPPEVLARVERLQSVCVRHGAALGAAALQFAAAHPAVRSVTLGASTPLEVADALAALRQPLPPALWAELKALRLLSDTAPVPA